MVAHNIANASTTAYKGERLTFSEFLTTDETGHPVSYVEVTGLFRDDSQGNFVSTANALDLAIQDEGYFVVETPEGDRYARNGHFQLDAGGNLVTSDGFRVLGDLGRPITLAPGDASIQIAEDGTVRAESGIIGKLRIVEFTQPGVLVKARGGLYSSQEIPLVVVDPHVQQGMLESSNVQPILQVTRMIEILRAYQSAQNLSQTEHDLMRKTINKILSVSS